MKVLIAGSEMAPLIKTGGLGDVLGALPGALAELGNDVIICIPLYEKDIDARYEIGKLDIEGKVDIGGTEKLYSVAEFKLSNHKTRAYLIANQEFFGRAGLYINASTGRDFEDNDLRFSFFCKVLLDLLPKLNWRPDILNVHDWQAALLPVYLRTIEKDNSFFSKTKGVLTIHNMAYQGKFSKSRYQMLRLPEELMHATAPMEFCGESNFLKGGISFADKIIAVSETYAQEIQGSLGCGLEGVVRGRANDVLGILNGVDYSIWSPETDEKIAVRYQMGNLTGKRKNKMALLNELGLKFRDDVPLVGMVSRLVEQKGLNLVIEGADKLFALDLQLVILGSGDKNIESELKRLESEYKTKMKVKLRFDETLAHKIEAGSDMYLMPSLFEPCGLNQMYSLKYGTPPIVHKVGGLADTVIDYNESLRNGTGFVFDEFTVDSMITAIERAIQLYSKKRKWFMLEKNGMAQDFSWRRSAGKYQELFESLIKS